MLDDTQGHVGFQQVCCEGVSQGVHRDLLAELELGGDLLDRPLSGRHAHRCLGSALGVGLERMIATVSGEEELRMLVRDPVPPEGIDGELADGDVAVLGTFAAMNVDHLALGVDVADLQVQSFAQTQAQRIDGPEEDSQALGVGGQDDLANLFSCDYFGQRIFVLEFEHRQDVPAAWAGDAIKELDAGERDAECSVGGFLLVAEVEKVAPQFCFRDLVGSFAAVIGQLPDGSQVAVDGPLGFAIELEIFGHLVVDWAIEVLGAIGFVVTCHARKLLSWGKEPTATTKAAATTLRRREKV